MNYSKAVFLLNDGVRAISCQYEVGDNAKRETKKTFDTSIKVGDIVVVPTNTRHRFTVVKVVETDIDIDIETGDHVDWIVGKVDLAEYERFKEMEENAIQKVKAAEMRKKRDELRSTMFKDHIETLKELEISTINITPAIATAEPGPTQPIAE